MQILFWASWCWLTLNLYSLPLYEHMLSGSFFLLANFDGFCMAFGKWIESLSTVPPIELGQSYEWLQCNKMYIYIYIGMCVCVCVFWLQFRSRNLCAREIVKVLFILTTKYCVNSFGTFAHVLLYNFDCVGCSNRERSQSAAAKVYLLCVWQFSIKEYLAKKTLKRLSEKSLREFFSLHFTVPSIADYQNGIMPAFALILCHFLHKFLISLLGNRSKRLRRPNHKWRRRSQNNIEWKILLRIGSFSHRKNLLENWKMVSKFGVKLNSRGDIWYWACRVDNQIYLVI